MTWGLVAVGTATVVGGIIASNAAGDAADTQANAANRATDVGNQQFQQTREDQAPYREAGYGALNKLNDLLGLSTNTGVQGYGSLAQPFTGDKVASDPGYQFGLQQGTQAIDNSAASHGNLYSGATLKALTRYGNDYGTTKFNDAFNRDQTQGNALANKLQSIAGLGQTSLGQTGALGASNASQVGENLIGAGNAQAAGGRAQSNAIVGGINQIGSYAKNNWPTGAKSPSAGAEYDPFNGYQYGSGGMGD